MLPVPYTPSHLSTFVETPQPRRETMNLDTCIAAWLHAKTGRSESKKTHTAYEDTLAAFRDLLQSRGRDLDSDPAIIAPLAQGWADTSKVEGRNVTSGTYNQRLAILSSFYAYAIKHEVLAYNPIERVERRVLKKKDAARPLASSTVKSGLASIDRSTPEGKRDYALLSIMLQTGRRVAELAGLRYGHIQKTGNTAIVEWVRCKGNKRMTDLLPEKTTKRFYDYLYSIYGAQLGRLAADAPIWVAFSDRCKGQAITPRTIQRVCDEYLGTSKAHATRHTWAVTMHKKGATLAEIGRGLGHSNLKTTSDYLEELTSYENAYASLLEDEFGI